MNNYDKEKKKIKDQAASILNGLETYDPIHGEAFRVYHYRNVHDNAATAYLGDGDHLTKGHCPRCGVRLVLYSGDPHNVVECPCCKYYPDSYGRPYDEKVKAEDADRILKQLNKTLEEAYRLSALLATIQGQNGVRENNLAELATYRAVEHTLGLR